MRHRCRVPRVLLLWLILCTAMVRAQDTSPSMGSIALKDAAFYLEDVGGYFTTPLRFTGRDWALAAGGVGATLLVMSADQWVNDRVGGDSNQSLNGDFWDYPTHYGVVQYATVGSLGAYAVGLVSGLDEVRIYGRMLWTGITTGGITVMALRTIFGRSRPYSGNGAWDFNWFVTNNESQSFPSGHTVVAFTISTVFAERIDTFWARIFFYSLAALTAAARVVNNQHWLSDVMVGAAIGIGAGYDAVRRERVRETGGGPIEVGVAGGALRLTYRLD
jgi:membrane-associated phospholipid phosphatase